MKYTIKDFREQFPNDVTCLAYLYKVRFPKGAECLKCSHKACFYPIVKRRAYVCSWCGNQIYPTAGTIFHKSPTSLVSWFHAIFLMSQSKNGVAAMEIQRHTGVTYKCAWRIAKQIRLLMKQGTDPLGGMIEADETYVGGKRHGKRGRGAEGKTIVFGVVEREGGIKTKIVEDTKASTIIPMLQAMSQVGSILSTDESNIYNKVRSLDFIHETVKHSANEYVRGGVHTNTIEGFWSQFKRSVNGTFHAVSPKYLQSYLDEFCFRYDHRHDEVPLPAVVFSMAGQTFARAL
jgi:transposase